LVNPHGALFAFPFPNPERIIYGNATHDGYPIFASKFLDWSVMAHFAVRMQEIGQNKFTFFVPLIKPLFSTAHRIKWNKNRLPPRACVSFSRVAAPGEEKRRSV
jgi:hypothetical protein